MMMIGPLLQVVRYRLSTLECAMPRASPSKAETETKTEDKSRSAAEEKRTDLFLFSCQYIFQPRSPDTVFKTKRLGESRQFFVSLSLEQITVFRHERLRYQDMPDHQGYFALRTVRIGIVIGKFIFEQIFQRL